MIFCSIVESQCEAPAGFRTGAGGLIDGDTPARFKCFVCTEPVCGKCSKLRKRKVQISSKCYGNVRLVNVKTRMVRVCLGCLEREAATQPRRPRS